MRGCGREEEEGAEAQGGGEWDVKYELYRVSCILQDDTLLFGGDVSGLGGF